MDHLGQPLAEFLDALAARTPTPGGGSASALGGALGTALAGMAAAYTTGGEKFKAVEPRVARLGERLTALRQRFGELMQKDIEAYGEYAAALALPKSTPAEKQARSGALAAAREAATVVPERIVGAAAEGLQVVEELCAVANPKLAGDVAVAAYFLEAAARGAAMQVLCNCTAADTEGVNARRRAAVAEQVQQCQAARERIHAAVMKLLKL